MNYEGSPIDYYGNAAKSGIQGQDVEVRKTEVLQSTDRLANSLEHLDKCVHELSERLSSVLAERSVGGEAQNKPEPMRVPLAAVLHDRACHVDAIRDRVQSILSRLEL